MWPSVTEWNEKYPPGTPVGVVEDDGSITLTRTRSAAWALGGGHLVVSLNDRAGGYSLERVTPLDEDDIAEILDGWEQPKPIEEYGQ